MLNDSEKFDCPRIKQIIQTTSALTERGSAMENPAAPNLHGQENQKGFENQM
jgi:hypothetical protein